MKVINMEVDIQLQIENALLKNEYSYNLRDVKVIEENGNIVLFGKVKTYFMKQMAQVFVMRVLPNGMRLKNQISVIYNRDFHGKIDSGED